MVGVTLKIHSKLLLLEILLFLLHGLLDFFAEHVVKLISLAIRIRLICLRLLLLEIVQLQVCRRVEISRPSQDLIDLLVLLAELLLQISVL